MQGQPRQCPRGRRRLMATVGRLFEKRLKSHVAGKERHSRAALRQIPNYRKRFVVADRHHSSFNAVVNAAVQCVEIVQ